VISKIGLTSTAAEIDETMVDEWLNQGVTDFLLQTRCNVNCADLTTTAGSWKYTLPVSMLSVLELNSEDDTIARTTPSELLRMRRNSTSTGTPSFYALAGNDLLMLAPTPGSIVTLELLYVPRPNAMTTGTHDPSVEAYGGIPSEYHKAIEAYALWQAGDYSDDSSSNVGSEYRKMYLELVREYKRAIRRKGGRSLGKIRMPVGVGVASDNSQDDVAW